MDNRNRRGPFGPIDAPNFAKKSSCQRLLDLIQLFTQDRPIWTVEQMAKAVSTPVSTTYRYVRDLAKTGLLTPVSAASYALGPAIIELDRQIRRSDPLLRVSSPIGRSILKHAFPGSTVVICRLYHDRVMCVHQQTNGPNGAAVSYERGLPMSLFGGATSKIILAHISGSTLKRLFEAHQTEIEKFGLGSDWLTFKQALRKMRQAGYCETSSELAKDREGVAAPIFENNRIVGSISLVYRHRSFGAKKKTQIRALVVAAAARATNALEYMGSDRLPRKWGQK